jgi:hypothetical protein
MAPPTPTVEASPTPTEVAPPTPTVEASPTPAPDLLPRAMFVCGYERCRDEAEYTELVFEDGIEVWASDNPEDDRILYTVSHHDEVQVIREVRIWEGPGGLWFELAEGGWISEFWLTDEPCVPDNLELYSYTDCMLGEY